MKKIQNNDLIARDSLQYPLEHPFGGQVHFPHRPVGLDTELDVRVSDANVAENLQLEFLRGGKSIKSNH